jgi:hypothetical protein
MALNVAVDIGGTFTPMSSLVPKAASSIKRILLLLEARLILK